MKDFIPCHAGLCHLRCKVACIMSIIYSVFTVLPADRKLFPGEVERVHFNCFPSIGEIKVDGFMVKQNSNFYHLPDTLLTKLASRLEVMQFLHVKARPLNEFIEPCIPENANCSPNLNYATYPMERRGYMGTACKSKIRINGKKHIRKRFQRQNCLSRLVGRGVLAWNTRRKRKITNKKQVLEHMEKNSDTKGLIKDVDNPNGSIDTLSYHCVPNDEVRTTKRRLASSSLVEAATDSELSSEAMSVSSIIKRYFSSNDIESSISNQSRCDITQIRPEEYLKMKKNMGRGPSLLPLKVPFKPCPQKAERSKLGKRLVMASYNLGISPIRGRPEISLCNAKGKKFQEMMTLAKSSCFEISDSED
ncbi:uncharacterized protein LOC103501255 isoform X1 [Cucumis melo]|uniref:Uncharacterized protein LOC103501255 isoform X1 n=1 Tax=Cucumis melo TaxID=3656 RepID=A0A1S4E4R0_CUCME|nr:uncharacterized protein LOC103501255 isoform X1 [Cucumis melo]